MTSSPYSGLSAGRRRRISADDTGLDRARPVEPVDGAPPREQQPAVPSTPLSDSDTRSLVRGAVGQTLSAIATGRPRGDTPLPPA